MSSDIQLDALPYIDQGYEEPGVREAVRKALEDSPNKKGASFILINAPSFQAMRLVEEETRRYRPTKNYLDFLPLPKPTFEVPVVIEH